MNEDSQLKVHSCGSVPLNWLNFLPSSWWAHGSATLLSVAPYPDEEKMAMMDTVQTAYEAVECMLKQLTTTADGDGSRI